MGEIFLSAKTEMGQYFWILFAIKADERHFDELSWFMVVPQRLFTSAEKRKSRRFAFARIFLESLQTVTSHNYFCHFCARTEEVLRAVSCHTMDACARALQIFV